MVIYINVLQFERMIIMSGHSKWHNIQKTKGAADAKRSAVFTKIARELIVAVKEGGSGDPNNNAKLAAVVAKAKAANMPNDNIKRTIDKALGSGNQDNFESVVYEGYGPSGVAVIVDALTDNRNRTASDVRHYFDKFGGNLGQNGCVSFMFSQKGVLCFDMEDKDEDTVMEDIMDCGADDVVFEDGEAVVYTSVPDFGAVRDSLEAKGYVFTSAQLEKIPSNYVRLSGEDDLKNMSRLLENLEDNDDVQNVWHNLENEEDLPE